MPALIPVNTKYIPFGLKEVLGNGINQFPEKIHNGDKFITEAYCYIYEERRYYNGWRVAVSNTSRVSYPEILEEINGYEVVSLSTTFFNCSNMKKAPKIPKGIVYMTHAFAGCSSMEKTPMIPHRVLTMDNAFMYCKSLKRAPQIPSNVESATNAFFDCTAMEGTLICHADIKQFKGNRKTTDLTLTGTKITKIKGNCSEETKQYLLSTKQEESVSDQSITHG